MLLIAYRHGLRASELCDLQWHQVELKLGACTSAIMLRELAQEGKA
jgi:integrase